MAAHRHRFAGAYSRSWIAAVAIVLIAASASDAGIAGGSAKEADNSQVSLTTQQLIDKIDASVQLDGRTATYADRKRHEVLLWMAKSNEGLRGMIAAAVADNPAGPALLKAGADIAAMAAWRGLQQNAAAGDDWSRLFQAYVYYYAAEGRHYITNIAGQALASNATAPYELAAIALLGDQSIGDRAAAERILHKLAKSGHPRAMAMYGTMLEYGKLGRKDPAAANDWYTRAAKAGDALGQAQSGAYLITNKIDPKRGEQLLRQAADQGLARAMYLLSYFYEWDGLGEKNAKQAARWRKKAVARGAMYAIIDFLIQASANVTGDQAKRNYIAEINRNIPGSVGYSDSFYFRLAEAYAFGYLLPKSEENALAYYRKAADLGNEDALFKLFFVYYNGIGTRADKARAWVLLEESARRGSADAYGHLLYNAETFNAAPAIAAIDRLKKAHVALDQGYARRYVRREQAAAAKRKDAQQHRTKEAGQGSEAEITQRQARQAWLGGGKWPPPDIQFKSAREWRRQYIEAPLLDDVAFVNKVDRVSLELKETANIADRINDRNLWLPVVQAIRAEGIDVLPSSPVKLQVKLQLNVQKHRWGYRWGSKQTDNNVFLIALNFIVPARLYRNGNFYHREVIVASQWSARASHGYFSRSDLLREIRDGFAAAMDDIRKPLRRRDDRAQWLNTLWKAGEDPAMLRKYRAARREKVGDLRRWLTGVHTYFVMRVGRRGAANEYLNGHRLRRYWTRSLRQAGLGPSSRSSIVIRHDINSAWHGPSTMAQALLGPTMEQFYWSVFSASIWQQNVIFNFNGRLYRTLWAILQTDYDMSADTSKHLDVTLPQDAEQHARRFTRKMRSWR